MKALNILDKSKTGKILHQKLHEANVYYKRRKYVWSLQRQIRNSNKHIFYCGICESSNMGDMAQTYCTLNWLNANYPEYEVIACRTSAIMDDRFNLIEIIKNGLDTDDFIVFQSGYNVHDLGGLEDLMHQKIIQNFPETVIIMLPQTVYFQSEERKNQCARVYNSHKKMIFFARDPISERIAKEMFPALHVVLYPDIVTSLIGSYTKNGERDGIYLCRRKDVEQFYSEDDYDKIAEILMRIDHNVVVSDTIISSSNTEIFKDLNRYVNSMIEYFGKFRVVITDKFHGLIFSLIANTPVIVIKTKDHKVTSGYEWFSKVYPDRVFFAESIDEISEVCKKILKEPNYTVPDAYFEREYYSQLRKTIDDWKTSLN